MGNVSSVIEGVSVYDARLKMGEYLANKIKQTLINVGYDIADIDYVVPVPETSKPSAIMVAEKLGITYRELLIKNRYVNRTFIMDSQNKRKHNIKHKFLLIDHLIRDKNIILVDDSIVRGNTLKHVVSQLRNAGARNIIVASCSAPIRYINRYGIDIQDPELLIARSKNEDEIAGELGANAVIYQSIYDMKRSIMDLNPKIKNFEMSVFEGDK
jgi:amidophosphoribosyltransferase